MDKFMNLAQQGLDAYQSHSNVQKTGGAEFNSPDNRPPSSSLLNTLNHDEVADKASQHGSGGSDLFKSAMGFLNDNKFEHEKPIDEEDVTSSHRAAYTEGKPQSLPASSLGSAAALEVLKKFTSGSSGSSGSSSSSKTDLISMAMAEASKLFDKSGGASSGNKQDAVNGAAMTVMKLLVQSKFGGAQTTGGSNSGGLSGLLSLASQFAK
ncbi:Chitinase 2 [Stygiomarasmius scandens]|uniref:Chitinase 2 n=1 Tax=Marasmiellus scandens TaxID=2682957 RepID=A0ABR1JPS6_9AGAR